MKKVGCLLLCVAMLLVCVVARGENAFSGVVVLNEPGMPATDGAPAAAGQMEKYLSGGKFVDAEHLSAALADGTAKVLVLAYGSTFPEAAWSGIHDFLWRGGNLVVIGGQPFTRAAYRDASGWHVRDYSVRFIRELMIDQYQETPGSQGLSFQANADIATKMKAFEWKRGFSPVIRLSAVDVYKRGGAAGAIDARLDTLAWGVKDGRKMAAPAIRIDHLRNGFDGGRWVFVNAEIGAGFFEGGQITALVKSAMAGSEEFAVRPVMPLYLPGEPIELSVTWQGAGEASAQRSVTISVYPQGAAGKRTVTKVALPAAGPTMIAAPTGKGLYVVEAELREGDAVRATYRSGFWIRDEEYLRAGPRLTVNENYFEEDGKPIGVVGTTYMSSEVQRLYFEHPNVFVWDSDMAQIHGAGLNMLRAGWWTGWDKFCDENGQPYEHTLRTMEAYLMTARKNGLPVQFNFFAFLPEVLGGANPYLDPQAVRKQRNLITAVVTRFRDVPFLAWDFINEPSISQHLWKTVPNGDALELRAWNDWLSKHYADRAALASAWNLPAGGAEGMVPLPEEMEFAQRGEYVGHNSLKIYDYFLFAQETFANWVKTMHDAVGAAGSRQLVTVGQDEGGIQDRLSPAFWGAHVDFTTNHSWWQDDNVLWDTILAKQPGKALLIQETGLQRGLNMDEVARRTVENEGALFERKVASSFIQSAGAIEWLWNTNSYMTESNETPIGAVRTDGTEKPEATVLRDFGAFAREAGPHLSGQEMAQVAIVTSQAAQFSVMGDLQVEAQRKAVRALCYGARLAAYSVAENQIEKLGTPRLVILPSPQVLGEKAWSALLAYVDGGGNLLITGPVERDEHWHVTRRATKLDADAEAGPLTFHNATLELGGKKIAVAFDQLKQNVTETLNFHDGAASKEIAHGRGKIFWIAYPVELAEGEMAATETYKYVAEKAGVTPAFDVLTPELTDGVLVYAMALRDSMMYVMTSDSARDCEVRIGDKVTGAEIKLNLGSQRAALALIDKRNKNVIAKYGF